MDIWLNNTTQGSPNYNGSGTMNIGTVALDAILAGLGYSPESGVSTTYYDDVIVDSAFIGAGTSPNTAPSAPSSLLTEGQTNPIDITDPTPEFSAIYNDADSGDLAPYYRLQVATSSSFTSTYWDTGTTTMATTTAGNRSPDISYAGSALASSTTYYWRIKFSDDSGATGDWSTATSTFSLAAAAAPITADILQKLIYTYDANGNITNITDNSKTGTGKIANFAYDPLNRLTSASTTVASSTSYTHSYTYTPIGNVSSSTPAGSYSYAGTGTRIPTPPPPSTASPTLTTTTAT